MSRKTTVTLPDDVHAAYKASGVPLVDLIRRALNGSLSPARLEALEARAADAGRVAAAEHRLAQVEERIAVLERETAGRAVTAAEDDFEEPPSRDVIEQQREEWQRQEAERLHRILLDAVKPGDDGHLIACTDDICRAWRKQRGYVYGNMALLVAYGLAEDMEPLPRGMRRWVILPQASDGQVS